MKKILLFFCVTLSLSKCFAQLTTSDQIIFTSPDDGYYSLSFQNTSASPVDVFIDAPDFSEENRIAALQTIQFTVSIDRGLIVTAHASDNTSIIQTILNSSNTDITPIAVALPTFNETNFEARNIALQRALTYLATKVTSGNMTSFIQTFRNQSVDYQNGLDVLQTAIQNNSTLTFLTATIKSDLIAILNNL